MDAEAILVRFDSDGAFLVLVLEDAALAADAGTVGGTTRVEASARDNCWDIPNVAAAANNNPKRTKANGRRTRLRRSLSSSAVLLEPAGFAPPLAREETLERWTMTIFFRPCRILPF